MKDLLKGLPNQGNCVEIEDYNWLVTSPSKTITHLRQSCLSLTGFVKHLNTWRDVIKTFGDDDNLMIFDWKSFKGIPMLYLNNKDVRINLSFENSQLCCSTQRPNRRALNKLTQEAIIDFIHKAKMIKSKMFDCVLTVSYKQKVLSLTLSDANGFVNRSFGMQEKPPFQEIMISSDGFGFEGKPGEEFEFVISQDIIPIIKRFNHQEIVIELTGDEVLFETEHDLVMVQKKEVLCH